VPKKGKLGTSVHVAKPDGGVSEKSNGSRIAMVGARELEQLSVKVDNVKFGGPWVVT